MDYYHYYYIRTSSSMLFTSLLTISLLPPSLTDQPPPVAGRSKYSVCSQPYKCSGEPELYYPFWGDDRPSFCGGGGDQFKLTCEKVILPVSGTNRQPTSYYLSIQLGSQKFNAMVLEVGNTIGMTRPTKYDGGPDVCSRDFNFSLSPLFTYKEFFINITIISDCPSGVSLSDGNNFTCNGTTRVVYYVGEKDEVLKRYQGLRGCRRIIEMPARALKGHADDEVGDLGEEFEDTAGGFDVRYSVPEEYKCTRCRGSSGVCGSNDAHQFTCYCPDGSNALDCFAPSPATAGSVTTATPPPSPLPPSQSRTRNWKAKLGIGVGVAAIATLLAFCSLCCFRRREEGFLCSKSCWLPTESNRDIEAFLKSHGALTLKRYKFSDVKKMTNSFKIKLGQGGFGSVYKGKLLNGSNVAVKVLTRSKGNGEEFINEVASISRTSHVNVVTLLGFCIEGHNKVLIYEFMSNGSLDKFIYNKGLGKISSLSWDNLYQIVIGIARGLEYLHRGCSTRILHFDIKPHNILLDENFCPKISDFGLAKLCPRKESIISMSDARGTIGYVAPEVWNRHFGGVSHKSDVYSYGMMLLEIVGGRNNINAEASHTSEIYFPDWIYKKLEQGTDLGVDGVVAVEENEVIKRITMVGLWCIQTFPNDRPTMSRVVEMLEGNISSLEMPPKPVLSSPVRSVVESSTTTAN